METDAARDMATATVEACDGAVKAKEGFGCSGAILEF